MIVMSSSSSEVNHHLAGLIYIHKQMFSPILLHKTIHWWSVPLLPITYCICPTTTTSINVGGMTQSPTESLGCPK